jgi:hypothetical protein
LQILAKGLRCLVTAIIGDAVRWSRCERAVLISDQIAVSSMGWGKFADHDTYRRAGATWTAHGSACSIIERRHCGTPATHMAKSRCGASGASGASDLARQRRRPESPLNWQSPPPNLLWTAPRRWPRRSIFGW